MTIGIIVVNYNGLLDTIECIDSLNQDDSCDLIRKIVIIDNGDIDQTKELSAFCPDAKVFRTKNNGFSAANNKGIDYLMKDESIDAILLLNNDTFIEVGFFKELLRYFDKHSVYCPKILYYKNKDTIWYGGGHISKYTGNAYHDGLNSVDSKSEKNPVKCSFATGCCLLFSKDIIMRIGKLNEEFFMYGEDVEFCVRCLKANINIFYLPGARIYHKISASTGTPYSPFSTYYLTRNRLIYIKQHKDYFSFLALYFTLISRLIKIAICFIRRDKCLNAYIDGICDYYNCLNGMSKKY